MPIVLLLFVVVPLVELYILIEVGQRIGALSTIGLCILTALLGGALLRQQGLETLTRARVNVDRGNLPALELFEGVALAVGGVLLLTPGFATDVFGFLCLIPFTRRWMVAAAMRRMHVVYGPPGGPRPGDGEGPGEHHTIEGDYERRDRHR